MTGRDVAVIGGGISGLACAALLAAEGHRVVLLEEGDELGGRAGSWARDGFRFDTGPSWYLMPEVFDHFYRLLGTTTEEQYALHRLDPGYRAYFEGEPQPFDLPAGRDAARGAMIALDPPAAGRLERYFDSATSTYELALRRFLYTSFESVRPFLDPEVLRGLPRLARLFGRSLDADIRSRTHDARLRRLLGYPAVFLGGSPLNVPSMYHLMSHLDVDDGVLYPEGGFARIVQSIAALAEGAGAQLRTGARVQRIIVEQGRARGVVVAGEHGATERVDADIVVATADRHHVETRLLDPEHREYGPSWWARREPGPGAVLAMLGVRGAVPELAHHTLLLADDWVGGFESIMRPEGGLPANPSLYIGKPSASDDTVAPPGDESLFVLVPVAADPGLGRGGVDGAGDPAIEAFTDDVIAQIGAWTGADIADRVVVRRTVAPGDFAADLHAWSGSALGPSHTLRQSAILRERNASARVRGLLYAGSTTIPGIGVPMCLISAELVLKRLRGDRSASPLPEPARERRASP